MSAAWLLLNAAYLLYTASAVFKEILYLRSALLGATFLYIFYGAVAPNWSVFFWNLPVAVLHLYAIWQLLKARRVSNLGEEAAAIRALIFPELDPASFNTFWLCGEERTIYDKVVIVKDQEVRELILILDGELNVEVSDQLTMQLSQWRLVGEMSSLSGQTANATVTANGAVRLRAWDKGALDLCTQNHPQIHVALLKAMGHEVVRKLR